MPEKADPVDREVQRRAMRPTEEGSIRKLRATHPTIPTTQATATMEMAQSGKPKRGSITLTKAIHSISAQINRSSWFKNT